MTKDTYPPEKRSWVMSRIKSKDTTPEIALRKRLWANGLRYRKDVKILPGRPDVVFTRTKVIIFIDGAFWHGKKLSPERLQKMSPYWQQKIQKNVDRDIKNTRLLEEMGYMVMRFTDVQVAKNLVDVVNQIKGTIAKQRKLTKKRPRTFAVWGLL